MTQLYDNESGAVIPCTVIDVQNVAVISLKVKEKDGYNAVVLGKDTKHKPNKVEDAKYKSAGFVPQLQKEVRIVSENDLKVGEALSPDIFAEGDVVEVKGVTKGKGFQGVVRKFGFAGGPKTHGQSDRQRAPGSIGAGTTPGRVWKGKKMPGRLGGQQSTIKNIKIVKVLKEKGLICVSGSVPGSKGGLVLIKELAWSDETHS